MILRSNRDLASLEILHWLIATTVAKFELKGLRADGVRNDLMTEADPKSRVMLDQLFHSLVRVIDCTWIARTVRQEDTVGVERFDLIRSRGRGKDLHIETMML